MIFSDELNYILSGMGNGPQLGPTQTWAIVLNSKQASVISFNILLKGYYYLKYYITF
jgi:hypothetical protein